MECMHCHQSVDGTLYWQTEDEKTKDVYVLCDRCFQHLEEAEVEAPVICAICHRTLDDNEEYLEEDTTGDCYCLPCFHQHEAAIIAASNEHY